MSDDDKRRVSPSSVRRDNMQIKPEKPIELNVPFLYPQTGRMDLARDAKNIFVNDYNDSSNDAQSDQYWDYFSTITPDIRLSNLNPRELKRVRWALEMHLRCMQLRLPKSAAYFLEDALSVTETSMAKDMALLKQLQTIRQESQHVQVERSPDKRNLGSLIGLGNKGG